MKVYPTKSFFRDVKKIINPALKLEIDQVIETVKEAKTIKEIPQLRKLKGYKIHYRIKVGRYRIGISIVGDMVTFWRFLPRKDFYKFFP